MPAARPGRLNRMVTTYRAALSALGVAAVGVLLLFFGGDNDLWEQHKGLQALANALGGTLVGAVALSLLWEFVGKRAFASEVLAQARTSTDVDAAGLVRVGTNYLEDPEWDRYFAGAVRLDIVVAYGRTWRRHHLGRLREMAARPGARIHIYLPDPTDTAAIDALAAKFGRSAAQLIADIEETRRDFLGFAVPGGADIQVFYRPGYSVFSFYRLDNTAILTLYSNGRDLHSGVPTFVCENGGSLFQFLYEELKTIRQLSRPATTPGAP